MNDMVTASQHHPLLVDDSIGEAPSLMIDGKVSNQSSASEHESPYNIRTSSLMGFNFVFGYSRFKEQGSTSMPSRWRAALPSRWRALFTCADEIDTIRPVSVLRPTHCAAVGGRWWRSSRSRRVVDAIRAESSGRRSNSTQRPAVCGRG